MVPAWPAGGTPVAENPTKRTVEVSRFLMFEVCMTCYRQLPSKNFVKHTLELNLFDQTRVILGFTVSHWVRKSFESRFWIHVAGQRQFILRSNGFWRV